MQESLSKNLCSIKETRRRRVNKVRRLTLFFSLMAPAFISGGMGLRNYFEYAPTFGWVTGLVLFLLALIFAVKSAERSS
jgi:hypothetical protein